MKPKLTIEKLRAEAKLFCLTESKIKNKDLFEITDGKAVEHTLNINSNSN